MTTAQRVLVIDDEAPLRRTLEVGATSLERAVNGEHAGGRTRCRRIRNPGRCACRISWLGGPSRS